MIPYIPKELDKKITFIHNDVIVKPGIILNDKEQEMFDYLRENLIKGLKEH